MIIGQLQERGLGCKIQDFGEPHLYSQSSRLGKKSRSRDNAVRKVFANQLSSASSRLHIPSPATTQDDDTVIWLFVAEVLKQDVNSSFAPLVPASPP